MTYVLVVDDEQEIAELLGDILDDEGYTVRCAHTALAALAIAEEHPPKLILFDMTLPDLDGADFINRYRSLAGPPVPLVALSGIADLAERANEIGADAYVLKPFEIDTLLETIAGALARLNGTRFAQ
jgi:two-component system, NtrC family, nitrogen regulation response regulator NtrX